MTFHIREQRGWQSGRPWVRIGNGWRQGRFAWRKTGATTWTQFFALDTEHPGQPALLSLTIDQARRRVTVVSRMPADDDLSHGTLKYASGSHPLTEAGDSNIYPDSDLVNRISVPPGSYMPHLTWTWTPERYNTKYYVSIWAVDTSGNASSRRLAELTIPSPSTPPPTPPQVHKITYNPVNSASYDHVRKFWNTAYYGNLAVQGGDGRYQGCWFYDNKIPSALANRNTIEKFTIRIQRAPSAHGVSGAANIYLAPHMSSNHSGGRNGQAPRVGRSPVQVGTLNRGQAKVFNVPTEWWPEFLDGTLKGFSIYVTSATPWTSPNYVLAYGKGTTSGQVYIEAR